VWYFGTKHSFEQGSRILILINRLFVTLSYNIILAQKFFHLFFGVLLYVNVSCALADIFIEFKTCAVPAHSRWLRVLSFLWEKSLPHGKAECRG
jgi:hypothetical protein